MYVIHLDGRNGLKELNKITNAKQILDEYRYFKITIRDNCFIVNIDSDDIDITAHDEEDVMFMKFYLRAVKYIYMSKFDSTSLYNLIQEYIVEGEDVEIVAYPNLGSIQSNVISFPKKQKERKPNKAYFIYIRDMDYHENQLKNFMNQYNLDEDSYEISYKYDQLLIHKNNLEYNMSESYVYDLIESHYDGTVFIACTIRDDELGFYVFDKDKYSKLIIVK